MTLRRCVFVCTALILVVVAPALAQGATPVANGEAAPVVPIATAADLERMVGRTVSTYIVPAYQTLSAKTEGLGGAIAALCRQSDEPRRTAAKAAFADTLAAWAGVDFLRFGPMSEEGRSERFAFWPDLRGAGERQLRQALATRDPRLVQPGSIARESAAIQGLPALETLLYAGDGALLTADTPDPYRCSLASAVAGNLNDIAASALKGWTGEGGWADRIEKPAIDNPVYQSVTEASTEVLKAIITGLEQVRDQRLLPAVGETPEKAWAGRAPYTLSGQALPYLQASAAALHGFIARSELLGLLPPEQRWVAGSVEFEFGNLQDALGAVGPDLATALADPKQRQKLSYAGIVLQSLRDLFMRQIAAATGITPGFNTFDGD